MENQIITRGVSILRKNYFWCSYFSESNGKKIWISRQSAIMSLVSVISGVLFLIFLYFTLGSAIKLSATLHFGAFNFMLAFFSLLFVFLFAVASLIFFKDIFAGVKVVYSGKEFLMRRPRTITRSINVIFMREAHEISSKLSAIYYSKRNFDLFAEGAEFYYTLDFVFADKTTLRFPGVATTSDILGYFFEATPLMTVAKFGRFTKDEVEKIANFFGVAAVEKA